MRRVRKEWGRRWAALVLAAVLLAVVLPCAAFAETTPTRILRVAFPQAAGFSETDADGTRHGLVVDYLNEIAKYTGWEYEYVDVGSEEMTGLFLDGAFDLMGGTYYAEGYEQYFAYPEYNCGYTKSVLLARWDDQRLKSYDAKTLSGKTIGVYERAKENIRRLEEYLSMNGIEYTLKYYSYEEMSEDGDLYSYLLNGEVDMLLGNNVEHGGDYRVVTSFDAQPHYIVAQLGDQEVLDGLNMAMEKIMDANPSFAEECYSANFPDQRSADIQLNEEEKAYIKQRGTVTVAVPGSWHPLLCLNNADEVHDGVVPDMLEWVSEFSGLEFSYEFTETYAEAVSLVQGGQADVLGFFLGSEEDATQQGLALTASYADLNNIVVRNKGVSYPADDLRGAIVEGRQMPGSIKAEQVAPYTDLTKALSDVNQGKLDFVYGLSARLEQVIQQHHFSNLVPVTLVSDRSEIKFALPRPVDPNLLTVLNKAINSLSNQDSIDILDRNVVSIGTNQLSLSELIYADPVTFVVIVALLLMLGAMVVLLVARARVRAAEMKSELERAEAKSRAKGEFLSRMSHEIRTPMNAVVGLTDLTSMMDGVPGPVQDNLSKIRSSSRYLLSLINDILDMSQIESGMLTIAAEPFSMNRMLNELQSMMGAEAKRRGLNFHLQKTVEHDAVTGDVIRLRQVLTNLLSNAFKFTPAGGCVHLRVTETGSSGAGAAFEFHVVDDGVGISAQDQERIFGAFEQIGSNISKSQGTGLGLAISRNIVHLMGGELKLSSEKDQGSDFYFAITLPLGQLPEEEETLKAEALLSGMGILVAEDNDLNAEIVLQLLEMQGARPQRAENGKLAVERFAASAPGEFQAILMDIQMPEMNGLEATRAIRALPRADAATVPIIAMTANSFKEDTDAATAAGMNGFVTKPLDVSYLYGVLRSAVKQRSGT